MNACNFIYRLITVSVYLLMQSKSYVCILLKVSISVSCLRRFQDINLRDCMLLTLNNPSVRSRHYTSSKKIMFSLLSVCLFVCLSVCLSTRLLKKSWTDFDETWWMDEALARDESIRLLDRSGPEPGSV